MEQLLTLKIFKILCESNEYITSQALADKLMISSRSVKTYMGQVKRICEEKQCELLCVRGKGY